MLKKYITGLGLLITFIPAACFASIDYAKYHDYRTPQKNTELQKMQEFHLQQAQTKLHNQDLAHAWGDLAYLLCHVPNHHEALQHMLRLAPQLNKQNELQSFFTTAIKLFPQDPVIHILYGAYLYNIGDNSAALEHINMAQTLE